MIESPLPILKFNYYTGLSSEYQELVEYIPPAGRIGYIQDIEVSITAASLGAAQLKLTINSVQEIKDEVLAHIKNTFRFGGKLIIRGKIDKGITVQIKSDGATTIEATASITGIEKEKSG